MRKLVFLLLLFAMWSQLVLAQSDGKRFLLRNSYSTLWNVGWDERFFYCWTWWEIQGDSLVFGPWNCNHVLRHWTFVNPELWCRVNSSRAVDVFVTFKYDYLSMSLRDSLTFAGGYDHDALDARLHFFSIGGRVRFKKLPLSPYIGQNVGLCRGKLKTIILSETVDNHKVWWYTVAEGSGGGVFVDVMVGAEKRIWREWSVFGEYGYRFTPVWRNFAFDSVQGLPGWQSHKFVIDETRSIRIVGPYVAIGLEVGL